ncbi:DUF6461 domain-containing protein, partial [Streptomyces sp. NPDC059552]|uniref:DUF6461 domain-containing protein n=1 Tax=Streptomyces sp. NPDC059552 TaxID=3346862 RepID=UPI00368804C4
SHTTCDCSRQVETLPASAGTRWISHYDNANANNDGSFLWAEDTELQLHFELREADGRSSRG